MIHSLCTVNSLMRKYFPTFRAIQISSWVDFVVYIGCCSVKNRICTKLYGLKMHFHMLRHFE